MCNAWAMEESNRQNRALLSLYPNQSDRQHKALNKCSLVPYGDLHCGRYYITGTMVS